MAEPIASAAGGASLAVLFVSILGPTAGPQVLIVAAAITGAMWPLSAAETNSWLDGLWLLLRCTLTALVLTGLAAGVLERQWGVPVSEGLAPVALLIGAMGNGWRSVAAAVTQFAAAFAGRGGRE
ncbi:hypothetical protein [Zoogloea sp.]|uniref:hypothetical protein n=1 Tax=Zoogloea sp. TaxID=49181 RepID=UPI001415EAF0|nr:MAG: hypothetical protein F9K15_18420 [Zoogloea sp.]